MAVHCRKKNLHALHSAYLQNVRRLFFKPFILHRRNAPYEAQRALRVHPSRRMSSDSRRILKLSRLKSHRYQVAGIFQIPVRQCTIKSCIASLQNHMQFDRSCKDLRGTAHVRMLRDPRLRRFDLLLFFHPFDFRTGRRRSLFLREIGGVTKFRDSLCGFA